MMKLSLSSALSGFVVASFLFSGCAVGPQTPDAPPSIFQGVRFQDEGSGTRDPAAFTQRYDGSATRSNGSATRNQDFRPTMPTVPEAGAGQVVNRANVVKDIIVTGNSSLPEHEVLRRIRTRPGRYFDPDLLQQDVNELWKVKQIRRVNGPFIDRQDDGIVVTIEILERPFISEVRFIGNRGLTDRELSTETGLAGGQPLDLHAVKMAKSRLEDLYEEKGFPRTQVTIAEGTDANDRNVVFVIHEDVLQRVKKVTFEGNQIASAARLKSFIQMKPGLIPYVGDKVNRREIEQDKLRLESYYRSLGFFNARIGRELIESDGGNWLTIRYIINEGPRYRIRNVSFIGNEKYSTEELARVVKLRSAGNNGPEFNAAKMNEDVKRLEDLYGSQGYVFARVQAEPRFLETPGVLDLVYNISEGEQYRVGAINVVIDGDYGVTQRQVVLNRLGLRPGDLIDTRKLRSAESRLGRSQLFADGSSASPGNPPKVVVKPPELDELQRMRR